MTTTWRQDLLGNVLTLQRGYDLPYRLRRPGTIPVVSSAGIDSSHSEAKVKGPGVVTGRYGTIGEVHFVKDDFWPLNTTLYVSDFKDNDPCFISYLLRTIDFHSHSGKTGVPGVNRNDLHDIVITLPRRRPEQEAIAKALSDSDALVTSLERLIAKKRLLKEGAMQELLIGKRRLPGFEGSWKEHLLASLGVFRKGRGIKKDDIVPYGHPCVRYGEIYTHHHDFIRSFISSIPPHVATQSTQLRKGDLLFATSGETAAEIGKCVAFVGDEQAYAGGDIAIFSPRDQDSHFLGYLLNHTSVAVQKAALAQGEVVVHISSHALGQLRLRLPQIREQAAIACILSDMDREISALKGKLSKARQIRQGMMQELMTGRVRLT